MSRIGNKSIALPDKVKVNVGNDGAVAVEGPKGKLNWKLPRDISAKVENNHFSLPRAEETRLFSALAEISRGNFQFNLPFGPSTATAPSLPTFTFTLSGSAIDLFPIRDIKIYQT